MGGAAESRRGGVQWTTTDAPGGGTMRPLEQQIRRDQIRRDIALAEQTVVVPSGASDEMRRIRLDVAERIIRVLRAQAIEATEADWA